MTAPTDPQILGEAADWLVQLHSGEVTGADHQARQLKTNQEAHCSG